MARWAVILAFLLVACAPRHVPAEIRFVVPSTAPAEVTPEMTRGYVAFRRVRADDVTVADDVRLGESARYSCEIEHHELMVTLAFERAHWLQGVPDELTCDTGPAGTTRVVIERAR